MTLTDRQVHITLPDAQIVRYNRAGKWYHENAAGVRTKLTLDQAVAFADPSLGGTWHENRYGGQRFDARVRAMLRARQR